ncbi:MAG: helix-turn-helix transcriptional regulator [Lachnospiraceae bacterium]|nr:helix-turn-helix transcriptional regulator [Lachnospiraceae bacterium]
MKKSDLMKNTFDIEKNTNDENVTTDVLAKICNELKCNVFDIMEFIPDEESEESV